MFFKSLSEFFKVEVIVASFADVHFKSSKIQFWLFSVGDLKNSFINIITKSQHLLHLLVIINQIMF